MLYWIILYCGPGLTFFGFQRAPKSIFLWIRSWKYVHASEILLKVQTGCVVLAACDSIIKLFAYESNFKHEWVNSSVAPQESKYFFGSHTMEYKSFCTLQLEQKRVFMQLNCCKNLYHSSRRENMKITVNIKVIKWHNENLLTFICL